MRRVFADNDVLLDAAHWGFLDVIPRMVGAPWESITVLDSLRFRTKKCDPKLFSNPRVAAELAQRIQLTAPPPGLDLAVLSRLEEMPGLDGGEIILISALAFWLPKGEGLLLTGDKRALRALAHPSISDIADMLRGKVLCREHLLRHVLEVSGPVALATGVDQARGRDKATDCIVPPACSASAPSIHEGLTSYLGDLAKITTVLVHP
ncbi:hypothetical protein [Geothrix sp. SG200]|uniref:hypothetical protein n=1 Tax=Geothrix sp. SG200 TaxID=2922865 RepID=UPI001FACB63A|nr:hypothetical protein [Geothrix sp. SG200]